MTSPAKNESSPETSLIRAAGEGDLPTVQALLSFGVDVNSVNQSGQTALMFAALMGHSEVVTHLIKAGANAHLRDQLGLTALEWSTRRGFSEISKSLTEVSPPISRPAPAQEPKREDLTVRDNIEPEVPAPPVEFSTTISDSLSSEPEVSDETQSSHDQTHDVLTSEVSPFAAPPLVEVESLPEPDTISRILEPSASTGQNQDEEQTQPSITRPIHHGIPLEKTTAPAPDSEQSPDTAVTPPNRSRALFSKSPFLSTNVEDSPELSEVRRCPKCNAVYENTWQLYCTRDRTPLVGGSDPHVAPAPSTSASPIVLWLLLAFVLGASAFAAYRLTKYFYRTEAPAPVAATPAEAPPEVKKPFFTIGGDIAGAEMTVPEPNYPEQLQDSGTTGPITVKVRVNKSGKVISTAVSKGDRLLRAAAVKAARQATFAPDKLAAAHPRNRTFSGTITYEFTPPIATAAPSAAKPPTGFSTDAVPAANADPNAPVVSSELADAAVNVPKADYPARARQAGVEGTITVTVRVHRNGKVISWRSTSGDAQLRAAAVRAARKATFASDKLPRNGDTLGTITYTFKP